MGALCFLCCLLFEFPLLASLKSARPYGNDVAEDGHFSWLFC
jgi:hypothetical protein